MVSVSEPTLSMMMEARLAGLSATLALLIPWSAIAPVADQFGAREDVKGTRSEDEASSVRQAVGSVEMTVRAEVASVVMPIESVLALKEGDLLRLNSPAAGGITLYADQVPVHTGRPGRVGVTPRRAGLREDHLVSDDALGRLGQSTAEACLGVLEMFAAGQVTIGEATSLDPKAAFAGTPVPTVAMSVSYVDGVTGGNVFLITLDGARKLAASMMGMDGPEDPDATELSELELSAVSEAMNQMMASAAAATSVVLGTEVEISTPETKTFTSADEIADAYPQTPHAVRTPMQICGEPARLVQLVPSAFVVRMSSALDDMGSELGSVPAARRRRRRGAAATSPRSPASRCACGPSWAARGCPPRRSSGSPRAPSSSSTSRPTTRSIFT